TWRPTASSSASAPRRSPSRTSPQRATASNCRSGRWPGAAGSVSSWTRTGGVTAPVFARLPLRPRALTLTAFLRLLVVDLFIHGVSGGRYDRVTDAVTAEVFGVAPPIYAVPSATLYPPCGDSA